MSEMPLALHLLAAGALCCSGQNESEAELLLGLISGCEVLAAHAYPTDRAKGLRELARHFDDRAAEIERSPELGEQLAGIFPMILAHVGIQEAIDAEQ